MSLINEFLVAYFTILKILYDCEGATLNHNLQKTAEQLGIVGWVMNTEQGELQMWLLLHNNEKLVVLAYLANRWALSFVGRNCGGRSTRRRGQARRAGAVTALDAPCPTGILHRSDLHPRNELIA